MNPNNTCTMKSILDREQARKQPASLGYGRVTKRHRPKSASNLDVLKSMVQAE